MPTTLCPDRAHATRQGRCGAPLAAMLLVCAASGLRADCPPADPGFREPPCRYRLADLVDGAAVANGSLGVNLDMRTTEVAVGDRRLRMATYNGTLPGPTLRLRRGDRLRIRLSNNMEKLGIPSDGLLPPHFAEAPFGFVGSSLDHEIYTNLHTHGLQVSPRDPGDNVLLFVRPGEWHDYEYRIADGSPMMELPPWPFPPPTPPTPAHPGGLFWYHPHFHGSTTHQGWQGLSGAIIIEGPIDEVEAVKQAKERLLILNELWVGEDGTVPSATVVPNAGWSPFTSVPAVQTDILFTINGVYQPEIEIREGETQRWRVLAAGPHRFFWLEVDGHELHQIAQDGIPFTHAKRVNRILLATGNRAEFILEGGKEGRYAIRALAYEQGHPGGARPERLLGTLVSRGKADKHYELPGRLVEEFNPTVPGCCPAGQNRVLTFKGDISTVPVRFTIDDKEFPHLYWPEQRFEKTFLHEVTNWSNCDPAKWSCQNVLEGRVEEWTLVNEDVFQHPFHLHVNPFQVLDYGPQPPADPTWEYQQHYGDDWRKIWWDVFRLPAARRSHEGARVDRWLLPRVCALASGEAQQSCQTLLEASSTTEGETVAVPAGLLVPGWVRIRIYFRPDAPGLTVYHCHILPHEDNGMMGSVCMRNDGDSRCTPQLAPSCTRETNPCRAKGGAR